MAEWWDGLSFELHVFYAIGIISAGVMLLRLLLSLIGFDGGDGVDFDIGDVDHGSGVGLFSVQTLSSFFVGFGWGGVLAIRSGLGVPMATAVAFGVGVVCMSAMYVMIRFALSLQSRGNVEYGNAVGVEGVVYVTLPGSGEFGGGQIEIKIQDRLMTANAICMAEGKVAPGTRVKVTDVSPNNTFTVEVL